MLVGCDGERGGIAFQRCSAAAGTGAGAASPTTRQVYHRSTEGRAAVAGDGTYLQEEGERPAQRNPQRRHRGVAHRQQLSDHWPVDLVWMAVLITVVLPRSALLQKKNIHFNFSSRRRLNLTYTTHRLLTFPRLHRRLIFFEFMAPVRINLVVIVGFGRRSASMRINSYVIRAE